MHPFGWVCVAVVLPLIVLWLQPYLRRWRRSGITEATTMRMGLDGRRLLVDPAAESSTPGAPPFINPKSGRVYDGFPLVPETELDGWMMGAITDPLEADTEGGCTGGDAFVQAPDGSRAGIVWDVGSELKISTVVEPHKGRWGVYEITFLRPVKTWADLRQNFVEVLPLLKELHRQAIGKAER